MNAALNHNSPLFRGPHNHPLNIPAIRPNRDDWNPYSKMQPSLLTVFLLLLISLIGVTLCLVTYEEFCTEYPWYWIPLTVAWIMFLVFHLFVPYARKQLWKDTKQLIKKIC